MDQKIKKIIISVRISDVNCDFINYAPYGDEKCFEVYKMLLSKYNDVFTNENFISFLKGISYEYEGSSEPVFNDPNFFNYDSVFQDDSFIDWIKSEENKRIFINHLIMMNDGHIIRKHITEEIYVVPLLNDFYQDANVKYIEELVNALRQEHDDLWLLLHDKDLYEREERYHQADKSEFENIPAFSNCPKLITLIENNKVYTFIHQNSDHFFSEVIKKLDELTLKDIIKEIENKRIEFAKDIAMKIKKEEMISLLENANETYDFSKPFLEL